VRDDGELEPELSIESTAEPALRSEEAPPRVEEEAQEPARGGAMRERLLQRAARVEQHSKTQERKDSGDDLDEIGKHLGDERPLGDAQRGTARAPGSVRSTKAEIASQSGVSSADRVPPTPWMTDSPR